MEDQEKEFLIDIRSGEVVAGNRTEVLGDGSYVSPPDWRPVDGFRLMEKFVSELRNPIYRERLREALGSGRGVFRQFKDTLKENKEIERRWFLFKEREMKRIVYEWYNRHREACGLEKQDLDEEAAEELVLSDFSVDRWTGVDEQALIQLDRAGFAEAVGLAADRVEQEYARRRRVYPKMGAEDSLVVVARAPMSDLAGFVWGFRRHGTHVPSALWRLVQLVVLNEFRGLGLSEVLLRAFLAHASDRSGEIVRVTLEDGALQLADFFEKIGFEVVAKTLELDLENWQDSE